MLNCRRKDRSSPGRLICHKLLQRLSQNFGLNSALQRAQTARNDVMSWRHLCSRKGAPLADDGCHWRRARSTACMSHIIPEHATDKCSRGVSGVIPGHKLGHGHHWKHRQIT